MQFGVVIIENLAKKVCKHGLQKALLLWDILFKVIAGTLTVRYGRFSSHLNVPKSTKTQRNKQIMSQRSGVFLHIFLRLHSKQPFRL